MENKFTEEEQNRMKYLSTDKSQVAYRERNAIYIDPDKEWMQEIGKCIAAIQIKKYGEIKFTDETKFLLRELNKQLKRDFKGVSNNKTGFITDAMPRKKQSKIVDVINLSNNDWINFEVDNTIIDKDCIIVYLK